MLKIRKAAVEMLSRLECGKYIVLMDRGYLSFDMIQHCNVNKDCYYVIRLKTGFTAIKESSQLPDEEYDGILDCWVTISNISAICRWRGRASGTSTGSR